MNKFKFTLLTVSCAAFLTACSSSSKGGTDNSDQIRKTESTLTQKIADLTQQVKTAQQQAQNNQSNYNTAKSEADKAQATVTQLTAEVAKLTKELAELNQKQAELAAEQTNSQLANAKQNLENQDALKKLEEKAQKAAEDLANAKQNLEKAQKDAEVANKSVEELNAKVAEQAKKRQEAEEYAKQLENLRADEKSRIPLSDKVFGGISGVMTDAVSGGVINLKDGKATVERTQARDIRDIAIVDSYGIRDQVLSLADSEYNDYIGQVEYSSNIANTGDFKSTTFGIYATDPYNPTEKMIYAQGKPTDVSQIPTSGTIQYTGGAAYVKDGVSYARTSKMNATADFDKKVIDITINEKVNTYYNTVQVPKMNFGGKITGNSFAGEVNGVKTQGGFFGENAKELSGVFTNDADKSRGVFGAIKQEAAQ